MTEEIWLPGEFSEIDWVLPVVRSDRCAEKYGPVARAADHAALHGAGDFAGRAVRRFAPGAGDVAIDVVHAALQVELVAVAGARIAGRRSMPLLLTL